MKSLSRDRLIIFGRYPVPGHTKTRLIPALGPLGAAHLQQLFTERTLRTAASFAKACNITIECCFEGGNARKMHRWLGPVPIVSFQERGGLGERMRIAMFNAFRGGGQRVVLLGTDVPGVKERILKEAFDVLIEKSVVLGPSTDGGYWLIGLKRPIDIFENIQWGSPQVLEKTLAQIRKRGLTVGLLDYLTDVDTPEDLVKWRPKKEISKVFLSVVIPTLNEEGYIRDAIASAKVEGVELIVVDGGSTDATILRAESLGARVIRSGPGRAGQQNRGALAARGENLLFLHGDTFLPKGYANMVFDTLMSQRTVMGAFRLKTDYHHPLMGLVEQMTWLRSRYLRVPYGDQALFMKRAIFHNVGGFPEVLIGEDLLFVRRMIRREKAQVAVLRDAVVTSGRRWVNKGPLKTTLFNQLMLLGIAMGIDGQTLSRLYNEGL